MKIPRKGLEETESVHVLSWLGGVYGELLCFFNLCVVVIEDGMV